MWIREIGEEFCHSNYNCFYQRSIAEDQHRHVYDYYFIYTLV